GFSKWLAHMDVFACGHGDLSRAVQSIFALLHPWTERASGMAYLACDYLGRGMDQRSRVCERESHFNHRGLLCDARFCRIISRECAAHHSHSMATVRLGTRSRTWRFGRWYLDCALELYRVG